jgi:hypothetical protein
MWSCVAFQFLYALVTSSTRVTFRSYIIALCLIILIISNEGHKFRSTSLRNFLHPSVSRAAYLYRQIFSRFRAPHCKTLIVSWTFPWCANETTWTKAVVSRVKARRWIPLSTFYFHFKVLFSLCLFVQFKPLRCYDHLKVVDISFPSESSMSRTTEEI